MYLKTMELREGWRERERESELSKMRAFWHARARTLSSGGKVLKVIALKKFFQKFRLPTCR